MADTWTDDIAWVVGGLVPVDRLKRREAEIEHELQAEDAYWDKLTKEGSIKPPDY